MQGLKTFDDLFIQAETHQLYTKLIAQLNKDLNRANIDLEFDLEVPPTSVKLILNDTVFGLIQERYMDYLNLLYVVDVPEEQIRQIEVLDARALSEQVTFLILLREWQKVWYKAQHS